MKYFHSDWESDVKLYPIFKLHLHFFQLVIDNLFFAKMVKRCTTSVLSMKSLNGIQISSHEGLVFFSIFSQLDYHVVYTAISNAHFSQLTYIITRNNSVICPVTYIKYDHSEFLLLNTFCGN